MERTRIKSPLHGLAPNTGPLATAAWCASRDLYPTERSWFVEIAMHSGSSRFAIEIYAGEWGFAFQHENRMSWIRVTDIPFIHGQDDFKLLHETTSLSQIGDLLRGIEHLYGIKLARDTADIHTSIPDADASVRDWVRSL